MRFTIAFLLCSLPLQALEAQSFLLSGTVRDAESKQTLAAAAIRIVGTSKGTVTNLQGDYRLSLDSGEYRIAFSYVGYKPDTQHVLMNKKLDLYIELEPSPIQLAEVVISGEDPAIQIMRQVIEQKSRWMKSLKTYQMEAFTRQMIRRDTAIASIAETYSTGYWQQGDTLREVIKQKRQTANVPAAQNLATVGNIVNFYHDEVRFAGFGFIGPTAPNAFDYYDFKLEKSREVQGNKIFTIQLNPKSRVIPLFKGSVDVVDERFVLAGVEVVPNEAFSIPFITDLRLEYVQHFALYEDRFWMPVDIRLKGFFEVGLAGFSFPRIGIEALSSIYDYQINIELPDTIFRKPRRVQSAEASKFDSSFWAQHEVLPLTREETVAYEKLDSTQTLQKQFQPSGPLVTLGETVSALKYADVRFNRVEGWFLGVSADFDSVGTWLRLFGGTGHSFSDNRWKWSVGVEVFLDAQRSFSLGGEIFDSFDHIPDESFHENFSNVFSTLLDKVDYRDYYYARGWSLFSVVKPFGRTTVRVAAREERQETAPQTTNFSLFKKNVLYRPNPTIQDGVMRSFRLKVRYGDDPIPLNIISRNYVEAEIEHANPSIWKGDFEFTRYVLRAEYRFTTFLARVLFPPSFRFRFTAGASTGALPFQRTFFLDSPVVGFGPLGLLRTAGVKEFGGEAFVVFSAEHNFRSTPFLLLNIPYLYKNSIELILHGTLASSWTRSANVSPLVHATPGWFAEAGIGINRIFGLFRIDATRRLTEPAEWAVTFSVADFF